MKLKNWFTTIGGLIGGIPTIINVAYPIFTPAQIIASVALGNLLIGMAAKDFNVTGVGDGAKTETDIAEEKKDKLEAKKAKVGKK